MDSTTAGITSSIFTLWDYAKFGARRCHSSLWANESAALIEVGVEESEPFYQC